MVLGEDLFTSCPLSSATWNYLVTIELPCVFNAFFKNLVTGGSEKPAAGRDKAARKGRYRF